MDDREILKTELMKLLDDIPLERLKALYIKALVASSAKVVNPDCRQGTEPREEIIAWIVEQLRKLPLLAYCIDFKGLPTGTGCATLLTQIVPVPPAGW